MNQKVKTIAFFVLGCAVLIWATSVLVRGYLDRTQQRSEASESVQSQEDTTPDGVSDPPDAVLDLEKNDFIESEVDERDGEFKTEDEAGSSKNSESAINTPDTPKNIIEIDTSVPAPNTMKASLSQTDCTNECTNVVGTLRTYCKQFCGLTPPQERFDDCSDLSSLNKDYCLRDVAVAQNDIAVCTQVSDTNIRTQCERRVGENIVDQL